MIERRERIHGQRSGLNVELRKQTERIGRAGYAWSMYKCTTQRTPSDRNVGSGFARAPFRSSSHLSVRRALCVRQSVLRSVFFLSSTFKHLIPSPNSKSRYGPAVHDLTPDRSAVLPPLRPSRPLREAIRRTIAVRTRSVFFLSSTFKALLENSVQSHPFVVHLSLPCLNRSPKN